MVSIEESRSNSTRFSLNRNHHSHSSKTHRFIGRSMRTIRSSFFQHQNHTNTCTFTDNSTSLSENLSDSVVDLRLGELASRNGKSVNYSVASHEELIDLSHAFSDFSACSSDISGELQKLACLPSLEYVNKSESTAGKSENEPEPEPEPCTGFLMRENFSTEIIESISPEDLQPTVKMCIDSLQSASVAVKRSAAAKLRLLAKNRADNRVLIAECGAVPALVPLLRCSDPWTQEHAVTALLNLSLHVDNKILLTNAGAVKSLIYVLKTGTEASKQNAACALLSLALVEENKSSIGASGAIPPLVSLLLNGSNRGKKDALTTLYKLCSVKQNKERAVSAGAVKPLVELVAEQGSGMTEKAMVVLNSVVAIEEGKEAIVEEGGIGVLVEVIEEGSMKGKEFSVFTLLQLCSDSVKNRGLLVREGGIPPLVALSQTGTARAKNMAEQLLRYLRESRQEASTSTS
ncbi:unnamed protein product [Lupinus luteus]|uniref:U-box domain-containing protein n=1 Tax=Lupinus luteus TaxID=3873 RepID=A0AAV1WID5_LUPLU